jgi:aryl-alcohol dehydrogenase-like predicted oxidoreductase
MFRLNHNRVPISESFALGTVQLGIRYGIANVAGRPNATLASEIVAEAYRQGVRYFDTAQDYGESEAILGRAFTAFGIAANTRVITKLSGRVVGTRDMSLVKHSIEASLRSLKVESLWALLLHDEMQLDQLNSRLFDTLRQANADGQLQRLGVSVYAPERALQALETEAIDVIQVPANIFDHRMRRAGVFKRAHEFGKFVFVRSVYLQGLALLEPDLVPTAIPGAYEAVSAFADFCEREGVSRKRFAADHIRWMAPGFPLVIGAESIDQLIENCDTVTSDPLPDDLHIAWQELCLYERSELIDPRTWRRM